MLLQPVEAALLLLLALLGTVGDHHQGSRQGAVNKVAAGLFADAGQRPAGHRQPARGPADRHRQDLFHAGRHSARGDLQLGEQLPAAAVGAEGFIGEVVHHHPILLVHHHHGGGNIIQHRLHQGHMVAQPLLQGIADADIPLHRQIVLQFPLRTEHRSDVNLHQVQAAVTPLVNQLAAPRLTLEQGVPHLLIDLARRLAAGQQARVLV